MALSGKYVSVKNIIAKVYRDLQLKDEEPFMDMIEWMAEALDFIHVYPQYSHGKVCFEISGYKTELPCDFISIEGIAYNGRNLVPTNNLFGTSTIQGNRGAYYTPYSYNQSKIENVLFVEPENLSYNRSNNVSFKIENGWLKTPYNEGIIDMIYVSQPMDEEGYPLIPDNQSFREAIYKYVVYKYLYSRYIRGEVSENIYQDAKYDWKYYCNQAGTEAIMPTLGELENLKRSFLSLKPRVNLFNNFYNSL